MQFTNESVQAVARLGAEMARVGLARVKITFTMDGVTVNVRLPSPEMVDLIAEVADKIAEDNHMYDWSLSVRRKEDEIKYVLKTLRAGGQ